MLTIRRTRCFLQGILNTLNQRTEKMSTCFQNLFEKNWESKDYKACRIEAQHEIYFRKEFLEKVYFNVFQKLKEIAALDLLQTSQKSTSQSDLTQVQFHECNHTSALRRLPPQNDRNTYSNPTEKTRYGISTRGWCCFPCLFAHISSIPAGRWNNGELIDCLRIEVVRTDE